MSNKNTTLRILHRSAEKAFTERARTSYWSNAFTRVLVDAALIGDEETLMEAAKLLRELYASSTSSSGIRQSAWVESQLTVLSTTALFSLDRIQQAKLKSILDPSSQRARILVHIHDVDGSSAAGIAALLGIEISEVRKALGNLAVKGFVVEARSGRGSAWHNTPRGEAIVQRVMTRQWEESK